MGRCRDIPHTLQVHPARICTSTTRISAQPDSDSVQLQIEINMDGKVMASYDVRKVRIK